MSRLVSILRSDRRGSVLAVVAVSLVAVVSVFALAVDLGMLFAARGEAQRAADAAALAGASVFIDPSFDEVARPAEAEAAARVRAMDYATRQSVMNIQVPSDWVSTEVVLDSQLVRVRIQRDTVPLFFARVFGIFSSGVTALAAARAAPENAGRVPCVKPFTIPNMWNNMDPTDDIYRREGDPPVWDFDAHLLGTPTDEMIASGSCRQQGQKWNCDPEAWSFQPGSYSDGAYGYGTGARNTAADYLGRTYENDKGRRVPMKIQSPQGGGVPSFWFMWKLPGNQGKKDIEEAIKGCVDFADLGQEVDFDEDGVDSEQGEASMKVYKAINDLIDLGNGSGIPDRDAYWDEQTGTIKNSSYGSNWQASPRVITVAFFNPEDMQSGSNTMQFVNFGTFFLEDPRVVYPDEGHKAPITARYMGVVGGGAGSEFEENCPEVGCRRLRLVQ